MELIVVARLDLHEVAGAQRQLLTRLDAPHVELALPDQEGVLRAGVRVHLVGLSRLVAVDHHPRVLELAQQHEARRPVGGVRVLIDVGRQPAIALELQAALIVEPGIPLLRLGLVALRHLRHGGPP